MSSAPSTATSAAPSTVTSAPAKKPRTCWTTEMEEKAIDLYVEAVRSGKRSDNGFKAETHTSIAKKLNESFETKLTDGQVKSKLNQSFKKDYDIFTQLKGNSGFGWLDLEWKVSASDEVWDSYLESHKDAKKFRDRSFPIYQSLCEIFGGTTATGRQSKTIREAAREKQVEPTALPSDAVAVMPAPMKRSLEEGETRASSPMQSSSPSEYQKRARSSTGQSLASAVNRLVDFATAPSPPLAANTAANTAANASSKIEPAVDLLQAEYESFLDESEILAMCDVLESETKATIFLRLKPGPLRDTWVERQIHRQ